ncbi:MAG: hypothetical protein GEU96_11185 [Propionibacteriales bacterium]|nr:hypothetical protein [Propionibacteriales bacterium]
MSARGYARQAGTAALVLAALGAGRAVTTMFPADDSVSEPFLRPTDVGETVELRYADITAAEVDGSTRISNAGTGLQTTEVFLVIPVMIEATGEPATISYAAVRDRDGTTYVANGSRSQFSPGLAQPGLPRYVTVTVELPVDAVAGAHLRVALNADSRRDDMADIDLGLTNADATRWAERTEVLTVPTPSETPPGDEEQS